MFPGKPRDDGGRVHRKHLPKKAPIAGFEAAIVNKRLG
jgi:hypothetical protein